VARMGHHAQARLRPLPRRHRGEGVHFLSLRLIKIRFL
jgi:hypothetical protein